MSLFDFGRYMEEIGFFDPKPVPGYSDVLVDREGNTFRPDGSELHQFNSIQMGINKFVLIQMKQVNVG